MLDTLKERKELDVACTYGEGEDSSAFDNFIFVPSIVSVAHLQAAMTSIIILSTSLAPPAISSTNLEQG